MPSSGLERMLPTYARADLTIVDGDGCRALGRRAAGNTSTSAAASPSSRSGTAIRRHSRPRSAQLDRLWHTSNLYRTEPAEELAARLSARFGGAQAFFCNSGAEAVEAALKYARKATGKTGVVALEGGFHGRTLGALSVTGQPAKREPFAPLVPGVRFVPPNDVAALTAAVDDEVGLILLEPVLGEGGVVPLEHEFVAAALRRCLRSSASTRCRSASDVPARSSPSSSSVYDPTSSHSRRGSQTGFPSVRSSSPTRLRAPSRRAITARRSAGIPWLRPPRAPSSKRSTTSCWRTSARAVPSSLQVSRELPVRNVRGRGLLVGFETAGPAGYVVEAARREGLLVLTAGEQVVRLAPPLTVSEGEVAAALAVLAQVVTLRP